MSEKEKENHPVFIVLRDWTKTNKGNNPVVAEKREKPQKNERN